GTVKGVVVANDVTRPLSKHDRHGGLLENIVLYEKPGGHFELYGIALAGVPLGSVKVIVPNHAIQTIDDKNVGPRPIHIPGVLRPTLVTVPHHYGGRN